jgi:sigma-70-like protein
MYVALPELPLESTLSRKVFLHTSGRDRRWSLSEILARPRQPTESCDPAQQRSRRIVIVAARGRQYLLLADEDLISLVETNNDPQAFATLYDRHSRVAFSLAYRMMGEHQAAEDLVQEAFFKLWRATGSYRAEWGSVRT